MNNIDTATAIVVRLNGSEVRLDRRANADGSTYWTNGRVAVRNTTSVRVVRMIP